MNLPLIFIVGPTGIGKSFLAIKIAKILNGEIINADSMQVYSDLSILTSRPTADDIKIIPHHLYGYINGSLRYNVANWCNDIKKIIEKNNEQKKRSIIVGGTGMYVDRLLNGLTMMPSISENIKKESENLLNKIGIEEFYNEVLQLDEKAAKKIIKKDSMRLRRIWEVYRQTNQNLTYWLANTNQDFIFNQEYQIYLFQPDRNKIYDQVNKRFINMINNGAIDEVKKLKLLNLDKSLPIMRAHGVPEISEHLSGSLSLNDCISKGQQVTRNYVKRQLTWWRSSKLKIFQSIDQFPSEIDIKLLKFT